MKAESAAYLAKAHEMLTDANDFVKISKGNATGRSAYLAGFHAAQALIYERTEKIAKTHNGVRTLFDQLTKDESLFGGELEAFLARAYLLKAVADYETGPGAHIPMERAAQFVELARKFVALIESMLDKGA